MNFDFDKTPYTKEHLAFIQSVEPLVKGVWHEAEQDGLTIKLSNGLIDGMASLYIDDVCWMTSNPPDLLDHRSILEDAYGNVILTGLGLGVGALFANANPNVNTITIIEKDERILRLIKPMVISRCKRITPMILLQDANNYVPAFQDFDFAFIDHAYARPEQAVINNYKRIAERTVVWFDERQKLEHGWL